MATTKKTNDEKIKKLRDDIRTEDYSEELKNRVNQNVNRRMDRRYNHHHHSQIITDFVPAMYFSGALFAGGINFYLTHNWLQAILHGLLSWAYVAFSWMSGVFPN